MICKKVFLFAAAFVLLFTIKAAATYDQMPEIFAMQVQSEDYGIGKNEAYVYKEYLETSNKSVNTKLREIVEVFDQELAPTLQMDPRKNAKRNSRLDISTVYYRTGEFYVSTMILARVSFEKVQLSIDLETRTYDLQTGERILLTDLFPADSPAWQILSDGVREQLESVFPGEDRDEGAIDMLCSRDALEWADFTLSGMELTLHYQANMVVNSKATLIHVRFFYPQFLGTMTQVGQKATDNSNWKMVAITCDDGPKVTKSTQALNAFRKVGARVTYFVVGKMLDEQGDIFINQFDQNQIFGCHTFNHWSGYSIKSIERRFYQIDATDAVTLNLVGEKSHYFRAPGGTYPPWEEAKLSLPIIQWSLDTYDYTGKSPSAITGTIRNKVREYDIILCHDTGDYLHKAIPLFGEWLTNNGYMMVTLDELAAAQGVVPEANMVYWSFRPGENSEDRSNVSD